MANYDGKAYQRVIEKLRLSCEHEDIDIRILRGGSGVTLFRGENKCFSQVSSGLYRCYHKSKNLSSVLFSKEMDIIKDALVFRGDIGPNEVTAELFDTPYDFATGRVQFSDEHERILAEIQHLSGKTNFIDFSKNLNFALFIACNDRLHGNIPDGEQGCGRVIVFYYRRPDRLRIGPDHWVDSYKDCVVKGASGMSLYQVKEYPNIGYSKIQSGVLVRSQTGVIDTNEDFIDTIIIPANDKRAILDYLKHTYGMTLHTVFDSIVGYVRYQKMFL